jgi:hypothetical protein
MWFLFQAFGMGGGHNFVCCFGFLVSACVGESLCFSLWLICCFRGFVLVLWFFFFFSDFVFFGGWILLVMCSLQP